MHFDGLCSSTEIHASLVIQSGISFRFHQEDTLPTIPGCPRRGFKKLPHQTGRTLIRTHQKTTSTGNRRLCAYTEPDRALPTKMGQNWRRHRSPPIWSICIRSDGLGRVTLRNRKSVHVKSLKTTKIIQDDFVVRMYLPHQPLTPNKFQNQLRIH